LHDRQSTINVTVRGGVCWDCPLIKRVIDTQPQIDFSRTPVFRDFMRGLDGLEGARKIVHGIFIELHPTWRMLVDRERASRSGYWLYDPYDRLWPQPGWVGNLGPYDVKEEPRDWEYLLREHGKSSPFLVKIYVNPTTPATAQLRQIVVTFALQQPFFTQVIDEPLPRMSAKVEGGADITASMSGTLGGFLRDQRHSVWGITCGHVAQSAGATINFEDLAGARYAAAGTVQHSNFNKLVKIAKDDICNTSSDEASAVKIDAALIELGSAFQPSNRVKSIGTVSDILDRSAIGSSSTVSLKGALTGPYDYDIQGYGVTQKVGLRGTSDYFCFSDVFDFCVPAMTRTQRFMAPLPVDGDSGSWVLIQKDQNASLAGLMFAVTSGRGVAAFAQALLEWASADCGLDLEPIP
jgi:hypothetical protein